jgi:hypothetical protein
MRVCMASFPTFLVNTSATGGKPSRGEAGHTARHSGTSRPPRLTQRAKNRR